MSLVFPAPAIVIGVGRFGLAVLERLGDDWLGLRRGGADASLANLRLAAVRAGGEESERRWCENERGVVSVARYLGEGDLPSLALDLVMLRSLGLVRYRDGGYQVATPRDAGVVETEGESRRRLRRRRYFEWIRLSPDPIVAAERLRYLLQRLKDLDVFVTPLLNRVKQGHSPRALLACIGRCRALQEGRDPTPWEWLRGPAGGERDGYLRVDGLVEERVRREVARETENHLAGIPVPPPLPAWPSWLEAPWVALPLEIFVPAPLRPRESDLPAPLDPGGLLARDWETTGWASEADSHGSVTFDLLPASDFRLGLFDHDGREIRPAEQESELPERLKLLAEHVHRGLVRLWVDLQRERIAEGDVHIMVQARQRDDLSDALQQSLEILGELVVRPLTPQGNGTSESPIRTAPDRQLSDAERELPLVPSRLLSSLVVEEGAVDESAPAILARRLARLGLGEADPARQRPEYLLADAPLDLADSHQEGSGFLAFGPDGEDGGPTLDKLRPLRHALNRQVRQLFGFNLLTRYRTQPTRRPPRLTVFVVGDLSEPFTRETFRPVLREVHAELLRAFSPIFETYREGFDRCLCVTPILWTPHPADPFPGEDLVLNRCEEAAIIDAIHGIRRWVESVLPPGRRCISQIFVNSRVTDTAALSLAGAIRQTRDFLSFQIRSDLSRDLWLRQTSAGAAGNDLFSSFSCYETDFPALRGREYLANRLARECLAEIKEGPEVRLEPPEPFEPPPVDRLVAPAREELGRLTRDAAEAMAQQVRDRGMPDESTTAREILARFDQSFERSLYRRIQERWSELTGRQGRIDDLVDELRVEASRLLSKVLDRVRRHSDSLIEDYAGTGGLKAAQAGFALLRSATRDVFQREEELRRASEALSLRHQIPDLSPVRQAREEVGRIAIRKPDRDPLRAGLVLWGFLCPVLGASLAHAVAYFFELHRRPGLFELLLGPGGAVVGGAALFAPAWLLARWHLRRRLEKVRDAIERMAEAVSRLLWGSGLPPAREAQPSVRAFLESRLELTGAVTTRGFALRVLDRAAGDARLAYRLTRGVDVQLQILARRGEDLGVRSRMSDGGERLEDLSRLFDSRTEGLAGEPSGHLIDPGDLQSYYEHRVGHREDLPELVRELIERAGGFAGWRERACLADSERILGYCRGPFESLVSEPISEQHFFAGKAGQRLVRFVSRCYSNLGFSAGFKGYEGLDPDNVLILADASLVVHPGLAGVFQKARQEGAANETLHVKTAGIRPNAAYMMSLVQGIRVHSMRNLKRFESFHNRVALPEDRIFPLSNEQQGMGAPINPLTGYGDVAAELSRGVRLSEQEEAV